MFKTRLISGILLVAVALLTIMSGSYILFFTLLGISLIGMQELYKAMQVHKEKFTLLEITGYVGAVIYYIAMAADYEKYGMMGLISGIDPSAFCICIYISKISCRRSNGSLFRDRLCCGYAFFYLPYP